MRLHDLVREVFPDEVEAEMQAITRSDTPIPTNYPGYIGILAKAIKNIRCALSPKQLDVLNATKTERELKGHPPEVQRV